MSRDHERVFLETVGPLAISAHTRRLKARAETRKDGGALVAPEPVPIAPSSIEPMQEMNERANTSGEIPAVETLKEIEAARMGVEPGETDAINPADRRRHSFAQRLRGWFARAS